MTTTGKMGSLSQNKAALWCIILLGSAASSDSHAITIQRMMGFYGWPVNGIMNMQQWNVHPAFALQMGIIPRSITRKILPKKLSLYCMIFFTEGVTETQ
jgi:hypothetical protein